MAKQATKQPAAPAARPAEITYASNRRALHEYHVLETVEAGLALAGTEVKSIRAGRINLRDAYARPVNGELWLWNTHISPWTHGGPWNHEPVRARKLLLHTREIGRLAGRAGEGGMTLVPLRVYDRKGRIKVELALVKGKKQYDKRQSIAERDAKREIDRAVKEAFARRA